MMGRKKTFSQSWQRRHGANAETTAVLASYIKLLESEPAVHSDTFYFPKLFKSHKANQTRQSSLQTYVVFGAELSDFGQVAVVGHDHPSLSLDRLHHESCDVWVLKGFLQKNPKTGNRTVIRRNHSAQANDAAHDFVRLATEAKGRVHLHAQTQAHDATVQVKAT